MYKVIYLYIVECSDGTFYTGVTNNLERRILEHNTGTSEKAYTFKRRPVKLVYSNSFTDFNLAFEWEDKVKKWSKSKKQALIKGDFELLKILSKKKFGKNQIKNL